MGRSASRPGAAAPKDEMTVNDLVLVVGGTRGTGLLAAQQLQQVGCPVRVLARSPERAAALLGRGIDVVGGDLTDAASLEAAMAGVTGVVFTAGVRSGTFATEATIRAVD